MKDEEIHPLGAGSVGGIKLILDAHTMTNRIDDYKKGFKHKLNVTLTEEKHLKMYMSQGFAKIRHFQKCMDFP